MSKTVTVYTSQSCGKCRVLKKWLDTKGIEYDTKDVTDNRLARTEVMKMGYTSVPITVVTTDEDKVVVPGPDIKKLTELLL